MSYYQMICAGEIFIGGYDGPFMVLVSVSIVACISRVMRAVVERTLFKGNGIKILFQKMLIFMLIGVINLIEVRIIETKGLFRGVTLSFYIAQEMVVLLENMVYLGVPVPEKIKCMLKLFQ